MANQQLTFRNIKQDQNIYDEKTRFEKIHTEVFEQSSEASKTVAHEISELIRKKNGQGQKCVLGLATGSSPTSVYDELVRLHKEEGLSFKNVVTFNLDEYYPIDPSALQSYVRFMNEYLFDHIDIDSSNVNIPDGTISEDSVDEYCEEYERKIEAAGGIDLQILGIGRTGHIGFNEPGSGISSPTRRVTLDHLTRVDAAADFFSQDNVPRKAITMGVGTILKSKRIILMAWGEGKSKIIQRTIEGPVSDLVPATYLQNHPDVTMVLDEAAASALTRIKTPWLVGPCEWTEQLTRKAIIWLCQKLDKPVLKLTDRDYNDNGMNDLVALHGASYEINIGVFNHLQHTITGWPGGKPNADDANRPERSSPAQKRVIIFSPHPDDDVISMGGTFQRLHDQGHEVHVAYQTSGNIAVFDDDAIRYADFLRDFDEIYGVSDKKGTTLYSHIVQAMKSKKSGEVDTPEVRKIKGLIRRGEAKAGCRHVGLTDDRAHFLNMPFYETGTVKKKPLGEDDIQITIDLLQKIKPHQIYAAGDLSDPHGTHRVCLDAIFRAIDQLKKEKWMADCYVWLYRGAWQEFDINDIDMAVPMSPEQLMQKRRGIFKHQSQKDSAVFPGSDTREFWQRAEDRNKGTAKLYDRLGLAEYEAIEAFKRYYF
ncbi:MAG: glucosamine-6-phosphate deaminase [Bacteroidetes bacterium]|nr:glucosamine-6-phosphate deaminase [Bacteroidota bacterium]